MSAALTLLPFPNLYPKALNTPRFQAIWEKWIEHRKGYKKPARGWDRFFRDQLEWLAGYGEEAAYRAVETSYMNGWQGVFPQNVAEKPLAPRKPAIPEWRVLQILEEELATLNNELSYDFDLRAKPALAERRNIVRAQIQQLKRV